MRSIQDNLDMARQIAKKVSELGGIAFFTGGYVRDTLLHLECQDIDLEIHGISVFDVESVLDQLGHRLSFGKCYGVYSISGFSLDISVVEPADCSYTHSNNILPSVPFPTAVSSCLRRDFTFNAMLQDVLTGEIFDYFSGREDLDAGILRHVNDTTFLQDPLRVFRAAQLAARFGFNISEDTVILCAQLDLSSLPFERVHLELKKALLKSERPSAFFYWLRRMNQLDAWFPELKVLIGVEQNPLYHAEGDVWNHTMMVVDEAAKFRDRVSQPYWFMLAALTHDFGKAVSTERINGIIHAYAHEETGLSIAKQFLLRVTNERKSIGYILNLILLHMKPNTIAAANSSVKVSNRMFDKAIDPEALLYIALADDRGRISPFQSSSSEEFLTERLAVYREYMKRPHVTGKDLLEAGFRPGQDFSESLAYAHKLRLAGVRKEDALKQTISYLRKLRRC